MSEFLGYGLALRATEAAVNSARPDSPVAADPAPRGRSTTRARLGIAAGLQSLARWVEPAERRTFAHSGQPEGC